MSKNLKSIGALVGLLISASLPFSLSFADETAAPQVVFVPHDKVENTFTKGGPLVLNENFKVQAGRRVTVGAVEIHEKDTDIFYILEGTAKIITGGTAVEKTSIGPGEFHAKEITGGETRDLAKGDVLVIPNGVPHQIKDVNGPFLYYVVKVTDKSK